MSVVRVRPGSASLACVGLAAASLVFGSLAATSLAATNLAAANLAAANPADGTLGATAETSAAGGRLPVNPMQGVDKTTLKAFVQRPLFSPDRALPAPPAALVYAPQPFVVPPPQPPSLQLVGVIEGTNAIAIVRNGGTTSMLHTGERVGQWRVTILPTGLRLTQGDRTVDYTLFNKGGGTSAPAFVLGGPAASVQPMRTPPSDDRTSPAHL